MEYVLGAPSFQDLCNEKGFESYQAFFGSDVGMELLQGVMFDSHDILMPLLA